MTLRYEVIESKSWRHVSGRRASVYGALPWTTEAERADWSLVVTGWPVRNPVTGQVGVGRAPFATRDEAETFANKLGKPSASSIGD